MAKASPSGTRRSTAAGTSVAGGQKSTAKSTQKRESLQSLRRDIEGILGRLKQADALNQQSVKSLQTAFFALEKRVGDDSQATKIALGKKVDQLSGHLTGIIKQTHQAVAQDLAKAKANPSVEHLKAAVKSAEEKIAKAELAQADALGKVNRHLAGLAKAIDARFTKENARQDSKFETVTLAIKSSQESTEQQLSAIEKASAEAILKIGERVVSLSDELTARSDKGLESVTEKIERLDEKTQSDFETYREDLETYRRDFERRVEGLEETQRNLDSYTDRSIAKLTARIDNLEYGLSSMAPPVSSGLSGSTGNESITPGAPLIEDAFEPEIPETLNLSVETKLEEVPQGQLPPAPVAPSPTLSLVTPVAPVVETPNAYASTDGYNSLPVADPEPSPYDAPPAQATAPIMAFSPTEYTPGSLSPIPSSQQNTPAFTHQPTGLPDNGQGFGQMDPSNPLTAGGQAGGPDYYAQIDSPYDISNDDLPYEDPAYAEHPIDGAMERPGSFKTKKKAKKEKVKKVKIKKPKAAKKAKNGSKPAFKLPGNRKTHIAGAALLVITVGYLALRGGSDEAAAPIQDGGLGIVVDDGTLMAPIADLTGFDANATTPADVTLSAIGEYQDNQGLTDEGMTVAPNTLEKAALGGDPVAEFQLGLSRLQEGKTADAVKLIRSSANKGQAAAQYRLAKLYEAGEGVTADAAMARQLSERAARNGNRIAMHDLALYYAEGRGDVDVNIQTAARWFEKAAQRGVVDSQYNLGVLYESGQGMPKDLAEAYVWYGIAARQGDQYAHQHLDVLKPQINAEAVTRAETRVAEFRPVSIDEAANGIFRNVAWAEPASLKVSLARAQIRETQTLLGQLGYDAGGADGSMGPKTRSAIVSFQKAQGLTETGQVDQALIGQLQKAAGKA